MLQVKNRRHTRDVTVVLRQPEASVLNTGYTSTHRQHRDDTSVQHAARQHHHVFTQQNYITPGFPLRNNNNLTLNVKNSLLGSLFYLSSRDAFTCCSVLHTDGIRGSDGKTQKPGSWISSCRFSFP